MVWQNALIKVLRAGDTRIERLDVLAADLADRHGETAAQACPELIRTVGLDQPNSEPISGSERRIQGIGGAMRRQRK